MIVGPKQARLKTTQEAQMENKFNPGSIVATAAVNATMALWFIRKCLDRHLSCDWGDVDSEDKQTNDQALVNGDRLFSAYKAPEGSPEEKVWVITEWDRSVTTVLFPSDY